MNLKLCALCGGNGDLAGALVSHFVCSSKELEVPWFVQARKFKFVVVPSGLVPQRFKWSGRPSNTPPTYMIPMAMPTEKLYLNLSDVMIRRLFTVLTAINRVVKRLTSYSFPERTTYCPRSSSPSTTPIRRHLLFFFFKSHISTGYPPFWRRLQWEENYMINVCWPLKVAQFGQKS